MAHVKNHDYHILPPSINPMLGAIFGMIMLIGAILWMHGVTMWLFLAGLAGVLYVMYSWWAEVVVESHQGDHTNVVQIGLRYGFILFIMSEVMFFSAWFWSFFKHELYPMQNYIGTEYIKPDYYQVSAWDLPLINTLLLLISGCAATWAHHAIAHGGTEEGNRWDLKTGLILAVAFGAVFTAFQAYEYYVLVAVDGWTFGGEIDFANFFMATGFHGFHVVVGTIFLLVCLFRAYAGHFTATSHVGFEAAAWYWHFVDVVWLFLFAAVYIWGMG